VSLPSSTTIRLTHLRELWVHTGTACNLSCPFCHEGSKQGDARIAAPTLALLSPVLRQAAESGVQRFAFTGGEPLILKGILEILLHALGIRPALVLTNGTAPFIRRAHQLALLREAPHPLAFRVSIDFPDEARHDAGRGLKNFRKALEGLRLLHGAGFAVGITRQSVAGEDAACVDAQFRQLMRRQRLPEDLPVVALPDLGAFGDTALADRPAATAAPPSAALPLCATSRMVLAGQHGVRFHACPLTDDAGRFDTGETLQQAVETPVTPDHRRCLQCFARGVPYGG
jgi:hypothetical protein